MKKKKKTENYTMNCIVCYENCEKNFFTCNHITCKKCILRIYNFDKNKNKCCLCSSNLKNNKILENKKLSSCPNCKLICKLNQNYTNLHECLNCGLPFIFQKGDCGRYVTFYDVIKCLFMMFYILGYKTSKIYF